MTRITSKVKQGAGALQFDGVDDVVEVPNAPTLEPADSFSVALWFRDPDSNNQKQQVLLTKGDYGCDRTGAYEIVGNPFGEMYGTTAHSSIGGYSGMVPAIDTWYDGDWHLAVLTWDDVADVVTFTVDGYSNTWTLTPPDEVVYDVATPIDSVLRFGSTPGCEGRVPFTGALDDVRLWNRALARSEVLAMLPAQSTESTLQVLIQNQYQPTSDPVHAAAIDDRLLLYTEVSPKPATPATVTWTIAKDGGPEQTLGTAELITGQGGPAFAFFVIEANTLDAGSYTVRSSWPGIELWGGSQSTPYPLDITLRPTAVTLTASPAEVLPGESVTLHGTASITVTDGVTTQVAGPLAFYETTGGSETLLGSVNLSSNTAQLTVPNVTAGAHTYEARYGGTSILAASTGAAGVVAGPQLSGVGLSFAPNPTLNTSPATAYVNAVGYRRNGAVGPVLPTPTGTVTIKTSPGGTIVATVPLSGGSGNVQMPLVAAGNHAFVAQYSGDANYDPSSSSPVTLTAATDVVQASGVGLQYTTFYPYRDSYRDTVAIRGTRSEPISVSIRIYSPSGSRLRTVSIASGVGAYSYAWNGRNSSGSMYAAGKYKVVQVLKDSAGVTKTVTNYVNLSAKRLYTYTKSYTKDHTQTSKKTTSWIAWSFTLPSATVYKSLTFSVYGVDSVGSGGFGPHDFTWCSSATWSPNCATRWKSFPVSWAWRSVTGSASKDRTGRGVRLYAWGGYGATQVKYGRVKVTYGILK